MGACTHQLEKIMFLKQDGCEAPILRPTAKEVGQINKAAKMLIAALDEFTLIDCAVSEERFAEVG